MSERTTDQNSNAGEEKQNQPDDLFETAKKMADKAEGFANKTTSRIKETEAFGKLSEVFKKVSDYMEVKSEEFNKSEFADKLEILKEKTVREADKYIGKAKDASKEIADDIDEAIESIKEKRKKKE